MSDINDDGETLTIAPSLDEMVAELESTQCHFDGGPCEFRLGRGRPMSKTICKMCVRLSSLIDLCSSWTQRVDTGRLSGRSVEIVLSLGSKTVKEAEAGWKIYLECDNSQRLAQKCLLRRYYASFSCSGNHYVLRDLTILTPSSSAPLAVMIAQLVELFGDVGSLPREFVHGNPTVASLSFTGRLPVALRHTVSSLDGLSYSSRYLLQVDYGGLDSSLLTIAGAARVARQKSAGGVVVGDEPLGAIITDVDRGILIIRPDATFASFVREYPRHANIIGLQLMLRGLFSLYHVDEWREFSDAVPLGASSSSTLHDAFDQLKGSSIPLNSIMLLKTRILKIIQPQTVKLD